MMILTRSIMAAVVLALLASPLTSAQEVSLGHGSIRDTWIWWLGLIVVVAAFAWAAIASTRWENDTNRDVEKKLLKSIFAHGEIDQQDYNSLSHDLEEQARDRDEQNRKR